MDKQIVVIDEGKMAEKIQDLPNQLENSWKNNWSIKPELNKKIKNIVICGMGGSAIAGHLLKELIADENINVNVWSDYRLPAWADENTLVVVLSYSGNTEETLDAITLAIEKKLDIIIITSGGKLSELATKNKIPWLKIDYNSPPRAAIGWLYGSLIKAMTDLGIGKSIEKDFDKALKEIKETIENKVLLEKAEELALTLSNKIPVILTYSPLTAVAKRWVNQLNENSKTFAASFNFPEACHNFIVGLEFPTPEKICILFLESNYAFSRNIARQKIIHELVDKKEIAFLPLSVRSGNFLTEQLLFIYFGDLLSYYLAGVYGVDPTPIESINFLKEQLKKV